MLPNHHLAEITIHPRGLFCQRQSLSSQISPNFSSQGTDIQSYKLLDELPSLAFSSFSVTTTPATHSRYGVLKAWCCTMRDHFLFSSIYSLHLLPGCKITLHSKVFPLMEVMTKLHRPKSFRSGRAAHSDPGQKVNKPKGARNSDTKYRVLIATWQGLTGIFLWTLFRSWSLGLRSTDYHCTLTSGCDLTSKPQQLCLTYLSKKKKPLYYHFFSCSESEDSALSMTLTCICLRSYTRFLILKPFEPCLMLSSPSHMSSHTPILFC